MDILITCQCEATHDKIHVYDLSGTSRYIGNIPPDELKNLGISSYKFLDIVCEESNRQYITWASVPDNSFDAIYMMNCPIYNQLRDPRSRITPVALALWTNIMTDAWRVLRPGGMIIIPPILGGPYPKRNKNGKVILNAKRTFIPMNIDDDAEYQKDNALKVMGRLQKEYDIDVPDWLLSTSKTSDLPFRINIIYDKDESSRRLTEKHIVFTKAFAGGRRSQKRPNTRKNDRRNRKTRRTRR